MIHPEFSTVRLSPERMRKKTRASYNSPTVISPTMSDDFGAKDRGDRLDRFLITARPTPADRTRYRAIKRVKARRGNSMRFYLRRPPHHPARLIVAPVGDRRRDRRSRSSRERIKAPRSAVLAVGAERLRWLSATEEPLIPPTAALVPRTIPPIKIYRAQWPRLRSRESSASPET